MKVAMNREERDNIPLKRHIDSLLKKPKSLKCFNYICYRKNKKYLEYEFNEEYEYLFQNLENNSVLAFNIDTFFYINNKFSKRIYLYILDNVRKGTKSVKIDDIWEKLYPDIETRRTFLGLIERDLDSIAYLFTDFKYEYTYKGKNQWLKMSWNAGDTLLVHRLRGNYIKKYIKNIDKNTKKEVN